MPGNSRPCYFASSVQFRKWLKNNHASCSEVLLGFYKKSSGRPSITYPEALDEALCFGWIDGVRKSVNAEAYTIRFTPRRSMSQWSAVNIKRAEHLSGAGRMHSSGLKALEGAKGQERKYSYEQRHESRLSDEAEHQFRESGRAWEFFQSQPAGYCKTAIFWVVSAKRDETRKRRLEVLISASAKGKRINLLAPSRVRKTVPKRQEKNR